MSCRVCCIIPSYVIEAVAKSTDVDEKERKSAVNALSITSGWVEERTNRLVALTALRGEATTTQQAPTTQSIVPDILLQQISKSGDVDENTREHAKRDLDYMRSIHAQAQGVSDQATAASGLSAAGKVYRAIYDAKHSFDLDKLRDTLARANGAPPVADQVVNEAYDNVSLAIDFYAEFGWRSIDNKGQQVISSVHFGEELVNAIWVPELMQMVYGDGNHLIGNFTKCVDVIAHEFTHAVTEHTSPLDYYGQSGALNEHLSDVFGIMLKQKVEKETVDVADWLIGEGCILPGVNGVALRSMKAPGTAYDDPRIGRDRQPNHMKDFVVIAEDIGGVHIYSGIPNRAFFLVALAFGGNSWEKAGKIWWATVNSRRIPPACTFLQFADVTVDIAESLYHEEEAKIVRGAWNTVGVQRRL